MISKDNLALEKAYNSAVMAIQHLQFRTCFLKTGHQTCTVWGRQNTFLKGEKGFVQFFK